MVALLPVAAVGQIIAEDNADPTFPSPYSDGWEEGDNGGFGFLPWTGGMYGNPIEIDTDTPEPDNDLGTPAFRYGTGGFGYWAVRPFASPMQAGQSFKIDFDPFAFPTDPSANGQFQSLIRFGAGGSDNAHDRFALYAYAYYQDGAILFGSDNWGVGGATANDNLNGGTPLPTTPCFSTGCTNYSMLDSSDGFSLTLDLPTIDTYRLRVVDDNVTKLDISGQLNVDTAGQGIDQLVIWSEDGSGIDIDTSYFTNLQILVTPSEGVDGDYNDDGKVDAADYVIWRKNVGTTNVLPNDPDGGVIGTNQYNTWRDNFGEMAPGSGSGLAGGVVPEPSSVLLLVMGCVAAVRLRRSR